MKIISGSSNVNLAFNIATKVGIDLTKANIGKFADGETRVEILDNMRGEDVFVIQSTSTPVNDNLMELLVIIDALKRSSAKRITAVMPYFGYARQDRKPASRTPISAKLVANLLTTAGADRVLTVDLHAGQIQGFFDIPVDTLTARPLFITDIKNNINGDTVIFVSPDTGGAERARAFAKFFDTEIAIIDKRRPEPGASEVMHVVGDVRNKKCVIVDDLCDSAGTLCNAAKALKNNGASSVKAYITHGVLTPKAPDNINNSVLEELVITDSIALDNNNSSVKINKLRTVTIADLLAKAIKNINAEKSISSLLDDEEKITPTLHPTTPEEAQYWRPSDYYD